MRRSNTNVTGGRLPPPPIGAAATPGRPAAPTPAEEDLWDSEDYSADSDDDEQRKVVRVAANYYDDPGPAETKPDESDKEEDERDTVVAKHWMQWADIIGQDCIYPVILTAGLDKAIAAVLVDRPEVRAVLLREVPRFGRNNFDGQLGKLPVVFVNGDELEDIKKKFRGNNVSVEGQNGVRTAFAPTRERRSQAAAPAPVPIRDDGPSTPRNRGDEGRDEPPRQRREEQPRRQEGQPRRQEEQPRRQEERPRRQEEQPRRQEEQPRRRERREESPPPRRRQQREASPPRRRRVTAEEVVENANRPPRGDLGYRAITGV